MSDEQIALQLAGAMAKAAIALVGGMDLNGTVPPCSISQLSAAAERLRIAAEAYNAHIFNMTLSDRGQPLPEGQPMVELSPAAQVVLSTVRAVRRGRAPADEIAAAALRALADQVVPDGPRPDANSVYHLMNWTQTLDQYAQRQQTRAEILAIAAELEGQS